jgi:RNA polymerase sigma-70 factor (ECF subfamily)
MPSGRALRSDDAVSGEERDGEVVARVLAGERNAFGLLVTRYHRMILVLACQKTGRNQDAEDIVQEAFVRAYRSLDSLREPDKFGSWLYQITFKLCIDHLRRRGRTEEPLSLEALRAEQRFEPAAAAEEDGLLRREEFQGVAEAIATLPDKYRLVLTLRYLKRLSYREIADHLGEPDGTVANRLHRAVKILRERLRERARPESGEAGAAPEGEGP